MPKLQPIHAIRYAPPEDGDISTRIAPPYDVLDEHPKQQLLAKDARNIVAVDLPVTPPKTVGPDEAYDEAGRTFRQWLEEGVLTRDRDPAVFAYEQVYQIDGTNYRRRGLFTALTTEDFNRRGGGIFRHEKTIKSGTDDRRKLMEATKAQLSPVFGVFSDEKQTVLNLIRERTDHQEPDFKGTTPDDGVEHRCWVMKDERTISALREALEPTNVFIADGHHRYTTALNYARDHQGEPGAEKCLFVLVPLQDPGLVVLPTHRVLRGLSGFSMDKLIEKLERDGRFAVVETQHGADGAPNLLRELPGHGNHAFGLYDPATGKTYVAHTHHEDPLREDEPDRAEAWRKLDLAVLHALFVDRIMRPNFGGDAIEYSYPHELKRMIVECHEGDQRLGIITQATPLEAVCDVAAAGDVMPPKSTFFYPKLATGLVINPLDE